MVSGKRRTQNWCDVPHCEQASVLEKRGGALIVCRATVCVLWLKHTHAGVVAHLTFLLSHAAGSAFFSRFADQPLEILHSYLSIPVPLFNLL
jgi:hypothetical protein